VKYPHNVETYSLFSNLSFRIYYTLSPLTHNTILGEISIMEDFYHYNSPYYNSAHNNQYWEPQLPPRIHIHPESPAGQLGYTVEELAPILREQQQFLRDESAQPPA
jgi:hypothetical protein